MTIPTGTPSIDARVNEPRAPLGHRLYDPQPSEDEYDAERARLAAFMEEMSDVESLVGDDNISDPEPYLPDRWIVTERYTSASGHGDGDGDADWQFAESPTEGCLVLDSATDQDTATGIYGDPDHPDVAWQVTPAMPWDDC